MYPNMYFHVFVLTCDLNIHNKTGTSAKEPHTCDEPLIWQELRVRKRERERERDRGTAREKDRKRET